MRLKQDPVYTRFGSTHLFLEPSDAMFDMIPTRPIPSYTRRKKVNRIYRRNRAGRMVLVRMFYNVGVGGELVIPGEQDGGLGQEAVVEEAVNVGGEAEPLEAVDPGVGPEVLEVEDLGGVVEALDAVDPGAVPEIQEQALLDEGDEDEADSLSSLLEAKAAPGADK